MVNAKALSCKLKLLYHLLMIVCFVLSIYILVVAKGKRIVIMWTYFDRVSGLEWRTWTCYRKNAPISIHYSAHVLWFLPVYHLNHCLCRYWTCCSQFSDIAPTCLVGVVRFACHWDSFRDRRPDCRVGPTRQANSVFGSPWWSSWGLPLHRSLSTFYTCLEWLVLIAAKWWWKPFHRGHPGFGGAD